MSELHLVRFYCQIDHTGLSSNDPKLKGLEKRELYGADGAYKPNQTFIDSDWLWFEAKLTTVPQIGWEISGIYADDFDWSKDSNPMVKTVEYNIKRNIFVVELSWLLFNQLQSLVQISKILRSLSKGVNE